ncbi:SIR2 family protein [Bacillus thuringiensis]|uniref:SIR2 family protein n=1 Tax=Bacillus thuringiensis TaxID=1428 RepID=UPI001F0A875B|nr:SIR2 family protein [Bacillus thuringiensis]
MKKKIKIKQEDISEVPDINKYEDIIKAAKSGNLIIFVGAGVSKLLNLPLWYEFAINRLNTIYKAELIDYRTYEMLKKLDAKKILTICKLFMKEEGIEAQLAQKVFEFEKNEKYDNVYSKLYSMNAIYITTNYDECLDQVAERVVSIESLKEDAGGNISNRVIYKQSDLLEENLKNGNVIHIHGSVKEEMGMIVTLNDYLKYYGTTSKENELSDFLKKVFNTKYVVLFMGYGLEEYEILEYMLSKNISPQNTKKHYMLYPAYKDEHKMIDLLNKYYNTFDVELIPYDKGKKGYEQLIPIIDEWSKVLSNTSKEADFMKKINSIDEIFKGEETDFHKYATVVIDEIKKDEPLEAYLFKNVNDRRWLFLLIEEGFYAPEKVPTPTQEDGGYKIPYWVQTDYLHKIVDQLQDEDDKEIKAVMEIIREVSTYTDDNNHIDNYKVWIQFIEILAKIPNQYIDIETINMIETWTDSKFRVDYVSYEIANKLMMKFLNSDSPDDSIKVEKIIDILINLDNKKRELSIGKYYFSKVFDKNTVKLISEKCSTKLLDQIKERINNYLGDSEIDCEFEYNEGKLKLKVHKEQETYNVEISDGKGILLEEAVDKNTIKDFTEHIFDLISNQFGEGNFEPNVKDKISSLYYGLHYKELFYSLFEQNGKAYKNDFDLLLDLFKDLLVCKDESSIEGYLNQLMNEDYLVFQKVLLYVIGSKFPVYNNVLWELLESNKGEFIFQDPAFEDELRVILEKIEELNGENQTKLLELINKGPNIYSKIENEQRYIDIWKQKRAYALRKIPVFNDMYEKLKIKTELTDEGLRPIIGKVTTRTSSLSSPLTIKQLSEMKNASISEFMKEFRTVDPWEGPTTYELGKTFGEFTKKYPNRIVEDLEPFSDIPYYYFYQMLDGLMDAWKEKESFNWGHLLAFVSQYINSEEFWDDKYKLNEGQWDTDHKSVLVNICRLLRIGSENSAWAFENEHYIEAKKILLFLFEKTRDIKERHPDKDVVYYVLNSLKGSVLQTVLTMSELAKNRDEQGQWDNEFRKVYDHCLKHNIVEAYILLGIELPRFLNLQSDWTSNKINDLKFDNKHWESFMVAFIYSKNVNKEIYGLMQHHYNYAIDYKFKEKDLKIKLAEHIAIGYLKGFEKTPDASLYDKVLKLWDYDMINEFIKSFCWESQRILTKDDKQRIIEFWDEFYIHYEDCSDEELNENDKKLLSNSLNLICILNEDEIDEKSNQRLQRAIDYVSYGNNSYVVIERLHQIIKESDLTDKRKIICDLMEKLVEKSIPDYPEQEIKDIVEYLYNSEKEEIVEAAERICRTYQRHGIDFLREIYDRYEKSSLS